MGKKETYAMAQARLLEEMPRKFPKRRYGYFKTLPRLYVTAS